MAVAISQTANPTSAGTGTTITYSGQSTGTAAHDRIVVLCVGVEAVSGAISSATINFGGGAVAMNSSTNGIIGNVGARIFWLQAPVGTTADFAITFGSSVGTANTQHIAVYSVTGAQGTAASSSSTSDTDADPISSGAITIPTSGGHISVYAGATAGTTRTWTGVTKGLETNTGSFDFDTGTSTTAGTPTITVSGGNNEDASLAWVNFAANASVERLPAQTNLALSPTAPTRTHFDNGWTISPATKDFVLSGSQPAVGMAWDLSSFNLLLSTTAPTFQTVAGISIEVPQGNLFFSTTVPTAVTSGISWDLSPARVDLALSATAPTLDFGRFPLPSAVDLVLSPTTPTVMAGVFKDPPQTNLALSPTLGTVVQAIPRDPAQTNLTLSPTAPTAARFPQFTYEFSPATKDLIISPTQPAVGMVKDLNTVDLTLSTSAATLTISTGNAALSPPTVDLALSRFVPFVDHGKEIPANQLALSPTAPTFERRVDLAPARVDLALSTNPPTPTISAANNTTIVPDTRDLVISGSQPAVGTVKDLLAYPFTITSTSPSAVISGAGNVARNPASVDLTISSLAPDAGLGSDIPIGQLVLSTTAPTSSVSGGVTLNISPSTRDLVLSPTAPTAQQQLTKGPATVDLVISRTAPTASVTVVGTISPATVDLIISTVAASVIQAIPRDPGRGDLALSTSVPTLSQGLFANPAQTNLVLTKEAPDVLRALIGEKIPQRRDLTLSTTAPTISAPGAIVGGGGAARALPFIASMGAMMTR